MDTKKVIRNKLGKFMDDLGAENKGNRLSDMMLAGFCLFIEKLIMEIIEALDKEAKNEE